MSVPRIDPSTPVHGIEEIEAAQKASEQWWNVEGEPTKKFQEALAEFCGMKHVELVNSGTSANVAALLAMTTNYIPEARRVGKGSEIITTALSFPTTVSPIVFAGGVPVFVDVERGTWNINPQQVREMITDKTKAIMVAHALGNPFNLDAIRDICEEYGLTLIEDACFDGNTLVLTDKGSKRIKDIKVGDMVLTRYGYNKVLESRSTGKHRVINKLGTIATPNHPYFTKNGIKALDTLSASDIVYVWNEKSSSIEEKSLSDIQSQRENIFETTTGTVLQTKELPYIERFGLTVMEISQGIMRYIIKTVTNLITILRTWNVYLAQNTIGYMGLSRGILSNLWEVSVGQENLRKYGIQAQMELSGTENMEKSVGWIERHMVKYAKTAVKSMKAIFQRGQGSAQKPVDLDIREVYNLKIENNHEFFANGILVHNCDALGGEFNGKRLGGFGHISTHSFYPAHMISTGEGGAVMTNNFAIHRGLQSIINWGRDCYCPPGQDDTCGARYKQQQGDLPKGYDHKNTYTEMGMNLKMSQIQAAIGVEQMKRLPGFIVARKFNHRFLEEIFRWYPDWFELTEKYDGADPCWFGYVVKLKPEAPFTKQQFEWYLDKQGIKSRAFFCGNITKQPVLSKGNRFEYRRHPDLSVSDDVMDNSFWIGVHPKIGEWEREYMGEKITEFLDGYKS